MISRFFTRWQLKKHTSNVEKLSWIKQISLISLGLRVSYWELFVIYLLIYFRWQVVIKQVMLLLNVLQKLKALLIYLVKGKDVKTIKIIDTLKFGQLLFVILNWFPNALIYVRISLERAAVRGRPYYAIARHRMLIFKPNISA